MKWCVKEDFPWVINEWLPQNNTLQIQYKIIAIEEFSVVIKVAFEQQTKTYSVCQKTTT